MTPTPQPPAVEASAKHLLDWAESIMCNGLPMSHCTQAEWDDVVKKWRDQKHEAFPDGQAAHQPAPAMPDGVREAISAVIVSSIAAHIEEYSKFVPAKHQLWGKGGLHARLFNALLTALAPYLAAPDDRSAELLEERLTFLADLWIEQQADYPQTPEGQAAAAAVRCCAREVWDKVREHLASRRKEGAT